MNTKNKIDVSIIIPAKNGGHDIEKCLSGIFQQQTRYTYEVIVIDSGSTDNTLEVVSKFPVKLIEIRPEAFGHGKTRNLGGRSAQGKYLVYLTQDASPADKDWLEKLIINFDDEKVAGAYSRWIPKADCNPMELRRISGSFSPVKEVRTLDGIDKADYTGHFRRFTHFSDVSSALRKEIWEKIPFNDKSAFAEDQEWAKDVLEAGYTIIYEAKSKVYHSHNDSLKVYFQRVLEFSIYLKQKKIFGGNMIFSTLYMTVLLTFRDWVFILRLRNRLSLFQKIRWLFYSMIRNSLEHIAILMGILRA